MNADPRPIMPGDRVLAYDYRQFVNDKVTPARSLMLPATVVKRYGTKYKVPGTESWNPYTGEPIDGPQYWLYPDLVDVQFDHMTTISHGHFTNGVEVVEHRR